MPPIRNKKQKDDAPDTDTPKKRKNGANGFIEFLSEFRKKDAYSGLHQKEISVIAGQEWNKQSQEVKELYRVRKLAKLSLPDVLEQNGMEGLPEKAKTRARKRKARPKKVAQEALVPRPSHTYGSLMEPEVPTPFSVLSESTPGMTDYSSVAGSLPPTPAFVESYVAQSRYGSTRMVSSFKGPVPAHSMATTSRELLSPQPRWTTGGLLPPTQAVGTGTSRECAPRSTPSYTPLSPWCVLQGGYTPNPYQSNDYGRNSSLEVPSTPGFSGMDIYPASSTDAPLFNWNLPDNVQDALLFVPDFADVDISGWPLDDLIFNTVLGSVVDDDILGMLARDTLPTAPPHNSSSNYYI